jgi:CubicO group peptidase (beta-lactamase class C family)
VSKTPGLAHGSDLFIFASMSSSIRATTLIIMVLVAHLAAGEANRAVPTNTVQTLETIRKKCDFPALAVVVVKDGVICDRAAVGVRKHGEPVAITTNDVFHIGSCTKSMTATVAAIFIEEGKLRWDTTISEVFPEQKDSMNQQYQNVTLEQLLQHRGGVPGAPPPDAWKRAWEQKGTSTEQRYEFIQAVLRNPPEAPPGTKCIYSNQGYAVVGAILEKINGMPWETLMRQRLFKPLKMNSAGFGVPGTNDKVDQPWGHTRKLLVTVPIQADNPPAIGPGGTVHCSLDDLAVYAIAHMKGEREGGLLKPETFRRLHTSPHGGDYACGWSCCERGWAGGIALTHNGSNTFWYVVMWLAPKKDFAVIVGTNTGVNDAFKGCDDVAAQMIHKWLPAK